MTENKVILAVNNGDGKTRLLTADAGRTVKVKLIPGNKLFRKATHSPALLLKIILTAIRKTQP